MVAIIETGGKQYRVSEGDTIYVEKVAAEENSDIMLPVIALEKDYGIVVGSPYVEGAKVTARLTKQGKGKKVTVFTYRAKKGSARKLGHRQPYSAFQIVSIQA